MSKTRVLILKESDEDAMIIADYGDGTARMCSTCLNEGSGHIMTEYWQERFDREFNNIKALHERLADGSLYLTDWLEKSKVDDEVIDEAISWLVVPLLTIEKTVKSFSAKEYKDPAYEIRDFLESSVMADEPMS